MKKLLLATTVLVAGASVAAAEVALSGDARMGLINDFGSATDTTFTSRARVSFGLSGESESGLSFGASFRADNAGGAEKGTAGSVFIEGAFGKLSMGDVDGAANTAVGHVDGVGLTGLGDNNENAFLANGGFGLGTARSLLGIPANAVHPRVVSFGNVTGDPTALYQYTAGALSLYASHTLPGHKSAITVGDDSIGFDSGSSDPFAPQTFAEHEGKAWSVGAAYTLDGYKFSLGYERLSGKQLNQWDYGPDRLVTPPADEALHLDADHIILGADATFGAFTVKARYGEGDLKLSNADGFSVSSDLTQMALSGTYTMDALSVTAFARSFDNDRSNGSNIVSTDSLGLGASYDLGGGAKVVGGVVRKKSQSGSAASTSDTAADIGVSLSF